MTNESSKPIDLSIVIVSYNTCGLLEKCLRSVMEFTQGLAYEIFVVDNASRDGSAEMVRSKFPTVTLIANPENLYFTKANNQALKLSKGRYYLILNPDTFIRGNTFKTLTDFMDATPRTGACGPKFLNADGTLQGIGHRFPTLAFAVSEWSFFAAFFPDNPIRRHRVYGDSQGLEVQEIEATGGSCMMVRKEAAAKVGFLDEGFLMYAEETDWCKRIRNAGWKIFYVPQASITHYSQKSSEQSSPFWIETIRTNSLLHYFRKHAGLLVFILLWPLSRLYLGILFLRRAVDKNPKISKN